MSLTDLAQAVLLGTERGQPKLPETPQTDGALHEVLNQLAKQTGEPVEGRVLKMAAVLAPYEEAGRRTLNLKGRALPPACLLDEIPVCSAEATTVLRRVLSEQKTLLTEWLSRAVVRGVRAPSALLPQLLDAGRTNRDLRTDLALVAGHRGRWLAEQNHDWSYLLAEDVRTGIEAEPDETWQEGRLAARKDYLKAWRGRDPEAARQALEDVWGQENASTRADLLSALQASISPDDEPFLESCLDDRSKQVRTAAAKLLGSVPGARRSQRMLERMRRLVQVKRGLLGTSLQIDVPAELDAAMLRDGLEAKNTGDGRLGEGAARLMQVVAATPMSFWGDELGFTPEALLKALGRSTWKQAMIVGLSNAAVREGNGDFAQALLTAKVDQALLEEISLLRLLPAPGRDEILIGRLQGGEEDARAVLFRLEESSGEGPWSEALGRAAWARFTRLMKRSSQDWRLHDFLATAARRLPVSLAREAAASLPRPAKAIPSLENKLNDFDLILDLRTRIHKELAP